MAGKEHPTDPMALVLMNQSQAMLKLGTELAAAKTAIRTVLLTLLDLNLITKAEIDARVDRVEKDILADRPAKAKPGADPRDKIAEEYRSIMEI